jgi:hypothetical protein
VAVLVVAAVGILASGSQPSYGPVVETVRQGDFELTIRSAKGRYAADEPIDVTAFLTYVGHEASVRISHGHGSPMSFGIREPVNGSQVSPGWRTSCESHLLERGISLPAPFTRFEFLPSGVWHVYALANFSVGDCGEPEYRPEAEIAITVEAAPNSSTEPPAPTELPNSPQSVTVRDGVFELTIRSDKMHYASGEPIDVTVALTYWGNEPSIETFGSGGGRFFRAIRQLGGDLEMEGLLTADCRPQGELMRGQPVEAPWGKSVAYAADDPNADFYREWFRDPTLWLPAGTWTFTVSTSFAVGQGCGPAASQLSVSLTVVVSDTATAPPDTTPPASPPASAVPTDDPTNVSVSMSDTRDGFQLTLTAPHQRYRSGDAIQAWIVLENVGYADAQFVLASSPLVALSAAEANGALRASFESNPGCEPFGYYQHGEPTQLEFRMLSNYGVDVSAEWLRRFVEGPSFTLPSGTWTLTTRTVLFPADCAEAVADPRAPIELEAEITVTVEGDPQPGPSFVSPPDWIEIPLATMGPAIVVPDGRPVCMTALSGGYLARDDRTGMGVVDASGEHPRAVVWRAGMTAWLVDGRAVLVDPMGNIVARDGDLIEYGGGLLPDGSFFACSGPSLQAPMPSN